MFDTVVISGEVGVKKPDPAIFRIALDQTGLQPQDVAFVGDSERTTCKALWPRACARS